MGVCKKTLTGSELAAKTQNCCGWCDAPQLPRSSLGSKQTFFPVLARGKMYARSQTCQTAVCTLARASPALAPPGRGEARSEKKASCVCSRASRRRGPSSSAMDEGGFVSVCPAVPSTSRGSALALAPQTPSPGLPGSDCVAGGGHPWTLVALSPKQVRAKRRTKAKPLGWLAGGGVLARQIVMSPRSLFSNLSS